MKFGLIGSNIGKSLSPRIHTLIMNKNGIKATYDLIDIPHLPDRKFLIEFDGLNITIPFKEKILKLVEGKDKSVEITGAVNTILNKNGIVGYNTDYMAILELLRKKSMYVKSALVIGAGGAARAAIAALKSSGTEIIHIQNRSEEKVKRLMDDFSVDYANFYSYDVIINAIPPEGDDFLRKIVEKTSFKMYIDFNYFEKSPLLERAEKYNACGINGIEILLLQAKMSEEIWNNKELNDIEWRDIFK